VPAQPSKEFGYPPEREISQSPTCIGFGCFILMYVYYTLQHSEYYRNIKVIQRDKYSRLTGLEWLSQAPGVWGFSETEAYPILMGRFAIPTERGERGIMGTLSLAASSSNARAFGCNRRVVKVEAT